MSCNDWQKFFDAYADRYDDEVFTKNTEAEVAFLIEHLQVKAGARILDLGCGTGRHSLALAKQGFRMTGVDLSSRMLDVARRRAVAMEAAVEWVQRDALAFVRPGAFDAVICLCEGALCLLDSQDDPFQHDEQVLSNISQSLVSGGTLIVNVLNACRQIRASSDDDVSRGLFDPVTLTVPSDAPGLLEEDGAPLNVSERAYTPPEFRRLLVQVGFEVKGIYGGTAGDWGIRSPKLDEYELMAIARKREVGK